MALNPPVLDDRVYQDLVDEILQRVAVHSPEWTDFNESDPGVALLELFAYYTESLRYRSARVGQKGRGAALRLSAIASALAAGDGGEHPGAPTRVNFFAGQLLAAEDLAAEQNYLREKSRRHNRVLHGCGIVSGLQVSVDQSTGGQTLTIAPGHAIDAAGEQLDVPAPVVVALPVRGDALLVQIAFSELPCEPVPAPADPNGSDPTDVSYSRIQESTTAMLVESASPSAVVVARVRFTGLWWEVDQEYAAPRVR
jgi:hypothetical protein